MRVETQRIYPPAALTEATDVPLMQGDAQGDLLFWAADLKAALGQCNADKAKIREWREDK